MAFDMLFDILVLKRVSVSVDHHRYRPPAYLRLFREYRVSKGQVEGVDLLTMVVAEQARNDYFLPNTIKLLLLGVFRVSDIWPRPIRTLL